MKNQKHKFAIGTKLQFPNFEILMNAGWTDDGEYIVHPIFDKTVLLSYLQICDYENKEVTIMYQHKPGEYSIEEDGLYSDWPFDLMPMRQLVSESLNLKPEIIEEKYNDLLAKHCLLKENLEIFRTDFDRLSKQLHRIEDERNNILPAKLLVLVSGYFPLKSIIEPQEGTVEYVYSYVPTGHIRDAFPYGMIPTHFHTDHDYDAYFKRKHIFSHIQTGFVQHSSFKNISNYQTLQVFYKNLTIEGYELNGKEHPTSYIFDEFLTKSGYVRKDGALPSFDYCYFDPNKNYLEEYLQNN